MTKQEFKARWESGKYSDGLTWDDVTNCAKEWGLSLDFAEASLYEIRYAVLVACNAEDADVYDPADIENNANL